jgi:hypothetical protein
LKEVSGKSRPYVRKRPGNDTFVIEGDAESLVHWLPLETRKRECVSSDVVKRPLNKTCKKRHCVNPLYVAAGAIPFGFASFSVL